MRNAPGLMALCLLAGCIGAPPKPAVIKGEYQPINRIEVKGAISPKPVPQVSPPMLTRQTLAQTFDFSFEGDITNALGALRTIQPQLMILPTRGKPSPLKVRVFLRGTTLERALMTIGEQGGSIADVVVNNTANPEGVRVYIQFHTQSRQ